MGNAREHNTVTIFARQFREMIYRINSCESALRDASGDIVYIVKTDNSGGLKIILTTELIAGLKHAAFERYSSLMSLGAKELIEGILESHKHNALGGASTRQEPGPDSATH
jgi:hypothetical protein